MKVYNIQMKQHSGQLNEQLSRNHDYTQYHHFDISYAIHMHPITQLKTPDLLDQAKNSLFEITCQILYAALPLILCFQLNLLPHLINLYLIGNYESSEMMSAVGLGTILGNIFGFLIIQNMSMGFSVICSYFQENKQEVGFMYQKTLGINFFICILITPLLYLSDRVLLTIGFNEHIVTYSSQYVWALVPSFYLFSFYETTKNYLQSQKVIYPSLIISTIGCILHYFVAKYFILNLGYPATGAAWAFNISVGFNCLVIYLYILRNQPTKESWIEWNICATNNIHKFLLQILTHQIFTYFQALAFQLLCIIACHLPNPSQISAHFAFTYSFMTFYFMIMGVSHCLNRTISLSIEQNNIKIAQKKIILGTFFVLAFTIIVVINIVSQKDQFVSFFHNDQQTIEAMDGTFGIFLAILLIDSLQILFFGMHKTLQIKQIEKLSGISFYIVGLGLALTFGYGLKWNIEGIWLGWLLGTACCLIFQIRLIYKLDWQGVFDFVRDKYRIIEDEIRTSRMQICSMRPPN